MDKDSISRSYALAPVPPNPRGDLISNFLAVPPTVADRFDEIANLQIEENRGTSFVD
ncbi:MAG: hypothetical protein ACREQA_10305 [Candidatus Binatia bacterium]